jgi:hypothetical protein
MHAPALCVHRPRHQRRAEATRGGISCPALPIRKELLKVYDWNRNYLFKGELSLNGFDSLIAQLDQQRAAINKALTALRDVDGTAPAETKPAEAPAARKGGMTPEGKLRLVAALKKRWAAKKRAAKKASAAAPVEAAPAAASATPAQHKGGVTEEGRKKLAAAMRKRWALAKAAGTTPIKAGKKPGRKKAS